MKLNGKSKHGEKKVFTPSKYRDRIIEVIDSLPSSNRTELFITFAAYLSGSRILIYSDYRKHCMDVLFKQLFSFSVHDINNSFDDFSQYRTPVSCIISAPPIASKAEDLFEQIYDENTELFTIKENSLAKLRAYIDGMKFSEDAMKMALEIANQLTLAHEDFVTTKIPALKNFLKAIAFLNGNREVKTTDLMYMSVLWNTPSTKDEYLNTAEGIVNDYTASAAALRTSLTTITNKLANARRSLRDNQPLNYYDSTITARSESDLRVDLINSIANIKAEVATLTDGKVENSKNRQLFELLKQIDLTERDLLRNAGIRS